MIDITMVHMSAGGSLHEHIDAVKWRNPENGQTGENARAAIVQWLREGGKAYVVVGAARVEVGIVEATPPYIRTHADGVWKDNLLALPRY
jgi:hypothetical protein